MRLKCRLNTHERKFEYTDMAMTDNLFRNHLYRMSQERTVIIRQRRNASFSMTKTLALNYFLSEGNPEGFPKQTVRKNVHRFPISSIVKGPE